MRIVTKTLLGLAAITAMASCGSGIPDYKNYDWTPVSAGPGFNLKTQQYLPVRGQTGEVQGFILGDASLSYMGNHSFYLSPNSNAPDYFTPRPVVFNQGERILQVEFPDQGIKLALMLDGIVDQDGINDDVALVSMWESHY